jgi:hypothetical protein
LQTATGPGPNDYVAIKEAVAGMPGMDTVYQNR